jgi:hypothetical protein
MSFPNVKIHATVEAPKCVHCGGKPQLAIKEVLNSLYTGQRPAPSEFLSTCPISAPPGFPPGGASLFELPITYLASLESTHPTKAALFDAGYSAKHVTLSLALRSSGDAGRGFRRDGAPAPLVA